MKNNKSLPLTIGTIVIILALVIVLVQNSNKKDSSVLNIQTDTTGINNLQDQTSQNESTSSADQINKTTPKDTTKQNPGTYTMTVVASHNSQTSCWTVINGEVYDVTSWINQHPGGANAILSLCGRDGSSDFNSQHAGDKRPKNELAGFKIGVLSN